MKRTPLRLVITGAAGDTKTKQLVKLIIPSLPDTFKTAHSLASEVLSELQRRTRSAA